MTLGFEAAIGLFSPVDQNRTCLPPCCLHLPHIYKGLLELDWIDRVLILNCPVNISWSLSWIISFVACGVNYIRLSVLFRISTCGVFLVLDLILKYLRVSIPRSPFSFWFSRLLSLHAVVMLFWNLASNILRQFHIPYGVLVTRESQYLQISALWLTE